MSNPVVAETRILGMILANLATLPNCYFYRSSTGAARGAGGRVMKFGVAGQADITGVAAGKYVAIECKTETGRQSDVQRAFQQRVESAGGVYVLARTRDDAIDAVRSILSRP